MGMPDLNSITFQVQHNCDISDAKYAGLFSVCGLALRLRDLYKWENNLEPWIEKDASEVLDWIGERENHWEKLNAADYVPIRLQQATFDPFDTTAINRVLMPQGIFYGAGFGRSLKPTFLLARIERERTLDGFRVIQLGREMARDLFAVPAFVQDDCVIVRMQTAKTFLWDAILYVNKSGRRALALALKHHGLNPDRPQELKQHLEDISRIEAEVYIRHELGELQDRNFGQDIFREILSTYPHSPIELFARAVKDLLADTHPHGSLRYILEHRKISSLAFYIVFMQGLPKKLFFSMIEAFEAFLKTENWSPVEAAVNDGQRTAKQLASAMTDLFRQGKERNDYGWAEQEMTQRLLKPLGL